MAKAPLADGVVYFLLVYNAARIVCHGGIISKILATYFGHEAFKYGVAIAADNDKFIVEAAIGVGRYYAR